MCGAPIQLVEITTNLLPFFKVSFVNSMHRYYTGRFGIGNFGNGHEGKIFLRHILNLYFKWVKYQVRIKSKKE